MSSLNNQNLDAGARGGINPDLLRDKATKAALQVNELAGKLSSGGAAQSGNIVIHNVTDPKTGQTQKFGLNSADARLKEIAGLLRQNPSLYANEIITNLVDYSNNLDSGFNDVNNQVSAQLNNLQQQIIDANAADTTFDAQLNSAKAALDNFESFFDQNLGQLLMNQFDLLDAQYLSLLDDGDNNVAASKKNTVNVNGLDVVVDNRSVYDASFGGLGGVIDVNQIDAIDENDFINNGGIFRQVANLVSVAVDGVVGGSLGLVVAEMAESSKINASHDLKKKRVQKANSKTVPEPEAIPYQMRSGTITAGIMVGIAKKIEQKARTGAENLVGNSITGQVGLMSWSERNITVTTANGDSVKIKVEVPEGPLAKAMFLPRISNDQDQIALNALNEPGVQDQFDGFLQGYIDANPKDNVLNDIVAEFNKIVKAEKAEAKRVFDNLQRELKGNVFIQQAKQEITTRENELQRIKGEMSTKQAEIASLTTDIGNLQAGINADNASIATLNGEKAVLDAEKTRLEQAKANKEAQQRQVQTQVTNLQTDIANSNYPARLQTLQTTIDNLSQIPQAQRTQQEQDDLDKAIADKTRLENEKAQKEQDLSNKQTQLNSINTQINTFTQSISAIDQQITAKQAEITTKTTERDQKLQQKQTLEAQKAQKESELNDPNTGLNTQKSNAKAAIVQAVDDYSNLLQDFADGNGVDVDGDGIKDMDDIKDKMDAAKTKLKDEVETLKVDMPNKIVTIADSIDGQNGMISQIQTALAAQITGSTQLDKASIVMLASIMLLLATLERDEWDQERYDATNPYLPI